MQKFEYIQLDTSYLKVSVLRKLRSVSAAIKGGGKFFFPFFSSLDPDPFWLKYPDPGAKHWFRQT